VQKSRVWLEDAGIRHDILLLRLGGGCKQDHESCHLISKGPARILKLRDLLFVMSHDSYYDLCQLLSCHVLWDLSRCELIRIWSVIRLWTSLMMIYSLEFILTHSVNVNIRITIPFTVVQAVTSHADGST
jgi:hypothetical protein